MSKNLLCGIFVLLSAIRALAWSSMAAAFQFATNGQAMPEAALDDAKKNMEK
jgi:hypothetical protein